MAKTVLAFGETLWDQLPGASVLGGAPFNFAYRVNSLGDLGLIVTRLGRDELGREAMETIRELGMDTRFVQWDEGLPTGTVRIGFDETGEPDYFIVPDVAYDRIRPSNELLAAAEAADCVCFGTLSQRAEESRAALAELLDAADSAVKLLDINLRKGCYSAEIVRESLERADILRCNDGEIAVVAELLGFEQRDVAGFTQEAMDRWGLSHCVVTLGERGSFIASAQGEQCYEPGYAVEVEDPCGSGDAFTAGCIHLLLRGRPVRECLRLGNAMGALVATHQGATAPMCLDEINGFLGREHKRICDPALGPFRAG